MVTFDTLKASHRLRDAGFEEQKADALVNAFAEDIGANLATKDDLALLRKEMTSGFETLRQEMTSGDEAIRKDMASEFAAVRNEMASQTTSLRNEIDALRKDTASGFESVRNEMALREERMNARLDRQTTRMTLLAAGLAGLILTAIGIASGILATL